MIDDKERVLSQIRTSLQSAHLPEARANIPPRVFAVSGDRASWIETFCRELEPLGGTSHRARDVEEAIEIILRLLSEQEGKDLLTWSDEELDVRGLGDALTTYGYTRLGVDMKTDAMGRKTQLQELERAAAGITGAFAGLADTGALALLSSAARPRLASLLPPLHIALLPCSRLFSNMATFFAAYPDLTREASNLVFVAGPSRTADIELTLTRGVHGPKFLHVVLMEWR